MIGLSLWTLLSALMLVDPTWCGNPLVPRVGMADPHAHVFPYDPDTLYIYATHDLSPNNTFFKMEDWWVWKTKDLVHYEKVSILPPLGWESPRQREECWATDAAESNGTFFWYLSTGPTSVAVVRSIQGASGPWEDVLGQPLLPKSMGQNLNPHPTEIRDPSVFQDPHSGHYYIYFGTFHYYVARLNSDMVSLAEKPKYINVVNPIGSAGPGYTDDKPFVHYANHRYYLSWGCFYAIASNLYGPYTYVGSVIDIPQLAPDFRLPDNASQPWWASPNLQDRHGSFVEWHGQTYFFTNDRAQSTEAVKPKFYRDIVAGYVHYSKNGSIAPVVIDRIGVGQYDSHRIEAENFFRMDCSHAGIHSIEQSQKMELAGASGGFGVGMAGGCSLDFPNVQGTKEYSNLILVGKLLPQEEVLPLLVVHVWMNEEHVTNCSFPQRKTEGSNFFNAICKLPDRITAAQRRRHLRTGGSIPENNNRAHLRLEFQDAPSGHVGALSNPFVFLDLLYFK